jgi:aspartyl-tRNA(Asn)/glutamyl-tRNA(Gln) amidotransferase subunit C
MDINDEMISKLSDLAKLEFSSTQRDKIRSDLNNILHFVEKLQKVDTEGVEPLIYMNEDVNVLRDDVAEKTITKEEALKNAPQKDSDYFKVPTVLSKERS